MSRRIEVMVVGDVVGLKRALGVPLSLWERLRCVMRAARRAWRQSG